MYMNIEFIEFSIQITECIKGEMLQIQVNCFETSFEGLSSGETVSKFFVSLPTAESLSHPIGAVCGPAQKIRPCVSRKIEELAKEENIDPTEIQKVLKEYVKQTSTGVHAHLTALKPLTLAITFTRNRWAFSC